MKISAERLEELVVSTLEQHAFLFADPCPSEGDNADDSEANVSGVSFDGGVSGRLSVRFPRELAAEMASNLLGMEEGEPIEDELNQDLVFEFVNVLAGRVLSEMSNEGRALRIGPPVWVGVGQPKDADAERHTVNVAVDEHRVEVILELVGV
ncbi:MAG: hypothetical protein GC161_15140 [Planctomycetaceae bacterium]|nr:hypothetical protein [Planctomycetaceae bacterium]